MTPAANTHQLLQQRAAKLAQRPVEEGVVATIEVVTVRVGGGRYALEVRHVSRILRPLDLCRLPDEDGELVGLTMVGGAAVPVADLGSLLMVSQPDRTRPFVVLLAGAGMPLGLLVDEVESVGQAAEMRLLRVPTTGSDQPGPGKTLAFERGITVDGVVLLDAEAVLAHPRVVAARTTRTSVDRAQPDVHVPPSTQENPCGN